jgi:hypothetical protein
MPTNAQLHEALEALIKRVGVIEERMKAYEEQAKESHAILRNVEISVNGYEQSFLKITRFLKWLGAVGTGVLITYIASIAIHYLHP